MEDFEFLDYRINKLIISGSLTQKYKKIVVRKILLKGEERYLIEKFTETQVFHENCIITELKDKVLELFESFKQLEAYSEKTHYIVLKSKKNKITILQKKLLEAVKIDPNHNKEKNYLLRENEPIYPLIELGIFNDKFLIMKGMYDKYKQINRFIEFIDEVLQEEKELNIVDFGCGKSYLTFIIYYYLVHIKKIRCHITGIDLKKEVIEKCNELKEKYQYEGLEFFCMDAKDFHTEEKIDIVISLHACDTATDYCLYHALSWQSKYIFSVPCCQKEVNRTIKNPELDILLKYGLVKERFSSLLTDSIRGEILSCQGYDVNLMEFVDFSHTPKNILIRAIYNPAKTKKDLKEVETILKKYNIEQSLYKLVDKSI